MCIVLFFNIFKGPAAASSGEGEEEGKGGGGGDLLQVVVYLGNGLQYLVHGTIIFNSFGNVCEEARATRTSVLTAAGVTDDLGRREPALVAEVQLFADSLDKVTEQAGPYFSCTHGFVFTFYGILATYLAVLIQSV